MSIAALSVPRLRTDKFPRPPKLNGRKKLALALGFVIWFVFGLLLKGKYHPVIAFAVGFLMSYGPLVVRILLLHYTEKLIRKGHIHKGMLIALAVQPVSMIVGYLAIDYINDILFSIGYNISTFLLPSTMLFIVPWGVMPHLWFKEDKQPPAAAA